MPTKLGQNFLRDKEVLEKIIESADLKADDFVIEIGPGEGVLTEKLIENAGKVLAIEIDSNLASALDSRFPASPAGGRGNDKVSIITGDILKINLPEILRGHLMSIMDIKCPYAYKVVANIPYYITSPIIQLFLETKFPPSEMILMVQKEVAERICAPQGKMSILAVSVQFYANSELLFYVDKKSFFPIPEVDSAVIKITPFQPATSSPALLLSKEKGVKDFFRIVKAGFSAKRKILVNNLSHSLKLEKYEVEEKLKKAGIGPTQRAQELSVEDWKKLSLSFPHKRESSE
ncbi:MAG: ribosomal RNA small subunit methyltransferase A [Candidatus Moranbacteria bacterium RIFOXYA12_FULL_35_19]|nr:MAG: Ribosomal RNA small subunit methyltransferase A [Candidatus Moranbacteria bacterium GW2011_GWF2_35_39]OGI33419.1 MAG: ribosomal RNA small subunit methyltransferase A [Candidatus Moranbacteria bacterium RIFOXYC12_FULL_36_13]OGI36355.1 MAG: ribosomal RNA small subunit methyltransferase A [Candidatus Moranbacteria bacterium RIFOXYA12_FULL_35_19]